MDLRGISFVSDQFVLHRGNPELPSDYLQWFTRDNNARLDGHLKILNHFGSPLAVFKQARGVTFGNFMLDFLSGEYVFSVYV